jgi:hypothetical protein
MYQIISLEVTLSGRLIRQATSIDPDILKFIINNGFVEVFKALHQNN